MVVRTAIILTLLGAALWLTACEESVDPIIGSEYPFTIWGFMNSGADTQYVRVFEVTDTLIPDTTRRIDAKVYSTNLTTGERLQWNYKKVRFDSTMAGHVFWSPFRAEYEHRYRVEVVRSDGVTSSAEVTVPSEVSVEVVALENAVSVPIRIHGDAPNLVGPKVMYEAINIPPANAWPSGTRIHPPVVRPVFVSYQEEIQRHDDGWRLTVNMIRDTAAVRLDFERNCLVTPENGSAPDIWLRMMEFSVVAADSSWDPPGGRFDPDRLAVPGTMSNVQNGYGFFGAGQGIRFRWQPSVEARLAAGYAFGARCPIPVLPVPSCMNPPIPCIGENPLDLWQNWLR